MRISGTEPSSVKQLIVACSNFVCLLLTSHTYSLNSYVEHSLLLVYYHDYRFIKHYIKILQTKEEWIKQTWTALTEEGSKTPKMVFSVFGDSESFVPKPWSKSVLQKALMDAARCSGGNLFYIVFSVDWLSIHKNKVCLTDFVHKYSSFHHTCTCYISKELSKYQ